LHKLIPPAAVKWMTDFTSPLNHTALTQAKKEEPYGDRCSGLAKRRESAASIVLKFITCRLSEKRQRPVCIT